MPEKRFPRIDQLLVSLGYGSRKEVQHLIRSKRVSSSLTDALKEDMRVNPHELRVDDEVLDHPDGILIMMHKPLGLICTHDDLSGSTRSVA
jgi:16S rRNA pseudouridine516 synthase